MKKTTILLVVAFFLSLTAQANPSAFLDKYPVFFKNAHEAISQNQAYGQAKRQWKSGKTLFNNLEVTIIGYYYFNNKGKAALMNRMTTCAVDNGSMSQTDANLIKSAVRAVQSSKVNVAYNNFKKLASSGSTADAKAIGRTMVKYIDAQNGKRRGGSQSIEEIHGLLGRIIGAVVGAVTAVVTGNAALIGVFAKVGGDIGDMTEDWIRDQGNGGDGVMARPNGDDCTPPYFEF